MPITGVGDLITDGPESDFVGVRSLAINPLRRIELNDSNVTPPTLRVPNSGTALPVPLITLATPDTNFAGRGYYRQASSEGDITQAITDNALSLGAPRFTEISDVILSAPVPQYGRRYGIFNVAAQALDRTETVLGGFRYSLIATTPTPRTESLDVWLTPTELRLGPLSYILTDEERRTLRTYQDFRLDVYRTSSGFWVALGLSRDLVLGGLTTSPQALLGPFGGPFTGAVTNLYAIASNLAVNGIPPTRLVETDHTSCVALGPEAVPLRALRVGGTTMRGEPWARCFSRGRTNLAVEWSGIETIQQAGTYNA